MFTGISNIFPAQRFLPKMNTFPLKVVKGGCPGFPARSDLGPRSVGPRDFVQTPNDSLSKYSSGKCGSDGAHIMASGGASKHISGTL